MEKGAERTTVRIGSRFLGPPDAGNGGYSCGRFAAAVDGPAEATLRKPVPLERDLTLSATGDGWEARDGEQLVAEIRAVEPLAGLEPPARPDPETAHRCSHDSDFLLDTHPFPGCFVCGPQHPSGLHLYAGPLDGDPHVCADRLDPPDDLPSGDAGALAPEIVWAALDCPSLTAGSNVVGVPQVLARLTVERLGPVPVDEPSVLVGWTLERDGRKSHTASALLAPDGTMLARARALWIELRPG